MKKIILFLFIIVISNTLYNCDETYDVPNDLTVQNFIWKGLNSYYLWQNEIDDLKDNRFTSQGQLNSFLSTEKPKNLFKSLLYDPENIDKWSWIVQDYVVLEQYFSGITKNNGMEFGIVEYYEDSFEYFGYVRYILPNSDAEAKGIQRGDIIYGINGTQLNEDNYIDLLYRNDIYTVNFGTYSNTGSGVTIIPNGINISLVKEELTENPIHTLKTFTINGKNIGYLFYNQFTANFDSQLNQAFAQLQIEGVSNLILDLRYNGGGSVRTAVDIASMITGQFSNQLFAKEKWNDKWQAHFENNHPEYLINNFNNTLRTGETINSLGLNKIIILATGSSASASELVINGLNPYIDVKLIGTKTHGKYVGSVTLYDSYTFQKDDPTLNKNHYYAMQPIVLEMVNKSGINDKDGFDPNIYLPEDFNNLGVIGDIDEPLLAAAIGEITTRRRKLKTNFNTSKIVSDSKSNSPIYNNMYVDLK